MGPFIRDSCGEKLNLQAVINSTASAASRNPRRASGPPLSACQAVVPAIAKPLGGLPYQLTWYQLESLAFTYVDPHNNITLMKDDC